MHWARTQVDPMLALRNVACNDRWDEAWPQIAAQLRQHVRDRRVARRQQRRARTQAETTAATSPTPPRPTEPPATVREPSPAAPADPGPRRSAANQPWRRSPACVPSRSRFSTN